MPSKRKDGTPFPSTLVHARARAEKKAARAAAHMAVRTAKEVYRLRGDDVPDLPPRELILWARRKYTEVVEDPNADPRDKTRAAHLLEQSAQYEQDGPQTQSVQVNVAQQVHPAAERLSQLPPEELAAELRRAGLIPGGEE